MRLKPDLALAAIVGLALDGDRAERQGCGDGVEGAGRDGADHTLRPLDAAWPFAHCVLFPFALQFCTGRLP